MTFASVMRSCVTMTSVPAPAARNCTVTHDTGSLRTCQLYTSSRGGSTRSNVPEITSSLPSGKPLRIRYAPPTRRSTSAPRHRTGAGPPHATSCAGTVQAANSRSGVAAIVRRTTSVRSAITILHVCREPGQRVIPEHAIALEPCGGLAQPVRRERAAVHAAVDRALDEPGVLEHADVLGHGDQRHLERGGELADRCLAVREP